MIDHRMLPRRAPAAADLPHADAVACIKYVMSANGLVTCPARGAGRVVSHWHEPGSGVEGAGLSVLYGGRELETYRLLDALDAGIEPDRRRVQP